MQAIYIICLLFIHQPAAIEIYEISNSSKFLFYEIDRISIPVENVETKLNLKLDRIFLEVENLRWEVHRTKGRCADFPTDTFCYGTIGQLGREMNSTLDHKRE